MVFKYLIGIDEAGRGPIAGPVAVGAVVWRLDSNLDTKCRIPRHLVSKLPLRDSKKLTARQRAAWWRWLAEGKSQGQLDWAVSLVGSAVIDRRGITAAVKLGIKNCLTRLQLNPALCLVKLDGLLQAPAQYLNQETIIRGDESEPIISLASIAAKVTRDNFMIRLSGRHPQYGFERHKGYGTRDHYQALINYGKLPIHRNSFLTF